MLPWEFSEDDLKESLEYYPDNTIDEIRATLVAFSYSSYYVPAMALLVIYCLFVGLILADGILGCLPRRAVPRWIRAHVMEAPLATKKHHVAVGAGVIRLPLRLQSIVVGGLFLATFVPIFCFYRRANPDLYYDHAWEAHLRSLLDRTAMISTGLLPLVIVTATRRALPSVSGIDFGNAMVYHRWLARFCAIHGLIHGIGWSVSEGLRGHYKKEFKDPYWNWGCAAIAMFMGLVFLSIRQLRVKAYEVFIALHVILALFSLVTLYFHVKLIDYAAWMYFTWVVEIAAAIWGLDRLVRWINKAYLSAGTSFSQPLTQAVVTAHGSDIYRMRVHLGASKVQPLIGGQQASLLSRFRLSPINKLSAGTSVRLTIPRLQFWSDHPFTVIDAGLVNGAESQGYVDLLIRSADGMTKQLATLLQSSDDKTLEAGSGTAVDRTMNVVLEGPYGHWHSSVAKHDDVLLFAGGVGITFCLPYFVQVAVQSDARCKLVWAIRDFDIVDSVADQLIRLDEVLRAAERPRSSRPKIELRVTAGEFFDKAKEEVAEGVAELKHSATDSDNALSKASSSASSTPIPSPPDEKAEYVEAKKIESSSKRLTALAARLSGSMDLVAVHGRPSKRVADHFEPHSDRTAAVIACGPASLCDDTREGAIFALRKGEWRDVEYVEECFDW